MPKLRNPFGYALAPCFAVMLFGFPLVLGWVNPLNLPGPEFLLLFGLLCDIALLLVIFARKILEPRDGSRIVPAPFKALDPYKVACLASGPKPAFDAAATSMVQAGSLQLVQTKIKFFFGQTALKIAHGKPLPDNTPALEQAVYDATYTSVDDVVAVRKETKLVVDGIEERLVRLGVVHAPN